MGIAINKKKEKLKINYKSPRKWSLPINILLFNLCRLWPFRQKRLWVFGAWEGRKYDDNAKYLFEYIGSCHPEIRIVWLTNSIDAVRQVRTMGYEAYLNGSKKGTA